MSTASLTKKAIEDQIPQGAELNPTRDQDLGVDVVGFIPGEDGAVHLLWQDGTETAFASYKAGVPYPGRIQQIKDAQTTVTNILVLRGD